MDVETENIEEYYHSLDILKLISFIGIVLSAYGFPGGFSTYISPVLNIGFTIVITIYGYLFYSHGADYKTSILKTLKYFLILFVVYAVCLEGYTYLVYGYHITAYFYKRAIFNFVVLNVWPSAIGNNIWLVQSILYALIGLMILDKINLLDKIYKPLCVLLFIAAIILGEGSGLIKWSVLGYTYIPGNFLTRTIPYMLLGKWIYEKRLNTILEYNGLVPEFNYLLFVITLILGVVLCYGELIGLSEIKALVYYNHLVGFIPITIALMSFATNYVIIGELPETHYLNIISASLYNCYTVVAGFLYVVALLLSSTLNMYYSYSTWVGILTIIISVVAGLVFVVIDVRKRHRLFMDSLEEEDLL